VTVSTASSGGNVTSDGGSPVIARGVCWSNSPAPTIAGPHTSDGTGTGIFSSSLAGLTEETTYYLKAYATSAAGTSYGVEVVFYTLPKPCLPDVTYGSKTYPTVLIGDQCWMKENLNIGSRINGSLNQTNNSILEKFCMNDLESNCDIYGGLYQWGETVQYLNQASNTTSWNPVPTGNVQGICPPNWHMPTDTEWTTLSAYLGGEGVAGGKMKETGLSHWSSPNSGATNSSVFTGLPGGLRYSDGGFFDLSYYAYLWSATEINALDSWSRILSFYAINLERYNGTKTNGFSARCVKDQLPPPTVQVVQNVTLQSAQQSCYNALETITVAGSGTTFVVQSGASATFIAGQKISYLPGTLVNAGGAMHGYISACGLFCNTHAPSKVAEAASYEDITMKNGSSSFVKIYPNPTTGRFILKMTEFDDFEEVQVDICGLLGEKILSEKLTSESKHEFSLSGVSTGVYLIRVTSGIKTETRLIIKIN
jgi:uncharacterized protein (TIGR02145 family)